MLPDAPPSGTVERWAWDYVCSTSLEMKLTPPAPPSLWDPSPKKWEIAAPGRPPELKPRLTRTKSVRPGALVHRDKRAEVIHTFLHHELQAAELMAWAIVTYPDTPAAFRRGLLGICRDEIRHMGLYAECLVELGYPFGSFTVRDWFWKRVPDHAARPEQFIARLAVGFEGGNLDHGARFTEHFAAAGDERASKVQAQITEEEIAHAAFGIHWFKVFTGSLEFETWRTFLPEQISPSLTRGTPINRSARERAGFPSEFVDALERWGPALGAR